MIIEEEGQDILVGINHHAQRGVLLSGGRREVCGLALVEHERKCNGLYHLRYQLLLLFLG